jgi:hypothetical protein
VTDHPAHNDDEHAPPKNEAPFLCARFAGGRFDAHAIPFDVLPDLAAYRNLLVEVAKMLFKRRNNNRVRVPKGFEDSFQIGLEHVEGGHSAVAIGIRLPARQTSPQADLGFPAYEEFQEAKMYVDDLIRHVQTTGEVPNDFPMELAGRFNPFGQSLQPGEFIELGYDTPDPVRYDTLIRNESFCRERKPTRMRLMRYLHSMVVSRILAWFTCSTTRAHRWIFDHCRSLSSKRHTRGQPYACD